MLSSLESYGMEILNIKDNPSINPKIINLYLRVILSPNIKVFLMILRPEQLIFDLLKCTQHTGLSQANV